MSKSSNINLHLTPLSILTVKRENKRPHTFEEIQYFIKSFTACSTSSDNNDSNNDNGNVDRVKDYHMTAWLMAICLNGMTPVETSHLTKVMMESGDTLDLSDVVPSTSSSVGKHSTGGVGDKISLILAPLVTSFGLIVPHMAGRGLSHTGGTIDKLESIPGFNCHLDILSFKHLLRTVGVAIVSPGKCMVPADKKMYALRDVTATVTSIPLQTSSIMSKKLVESADSLVLDVKFGLGAFQQNAEDGIELAKSMIAVGESCGRRTSAFITRMDQPIGRAVGNWLEVVESIQTLKNNGPKDLVDLVLAEAGQMLIQGGVAESNDLGKAINMARENLINGKALQKFYDMVEAQGGDLEYVKDFEKVKPAKYQANVHATVTGIVTSIDSHEIGLTAVMLGAGRQCAEESVCPLAGVYLHKKIGDDIMVGDVLATIDTEQGEDILDVAAKRVENLFIISDGKVDVQSQKLITHFVTKDSVEEFDMSLLDF